MFRGSIVAIVTPFHKGKLDEKAFEKLMKMQIAAGTSGVVIAGTTGESPNLSQDEISAMVGIAQDARKAAKSSIGIIIGTGANSTETSVRKTRAAAKLSPQGVLVVTPYYNKPSQEGLFQHFSEVASAAGDVPVILYNVPGRTGCNLLPQTVARLAMIDNVVSVKEASGNLGQVSEIFITVCARSKKNFTVLSGDDPLTLPILSVGGSGVISVTANVDPAGVKKCVDLFGEGDTVGAREIHDSLFELHNAMFYESNPVPVKTALAMMGLIKEEFRLPLCAMAAANRERLESVLKGRGLIKKH